MHPALNTDRRRAYHALLPPPVVCWLRHRHHRVSTDIATRSIIFTNVKKDWLLINEIFPLEEGTEVEDLPCTKASQGHDREPRKVLHSAVGRDYSEEQNGTMSERLIR